MSSFGCGMLGEGMWCIITHANQCDDIGCRDIYGDKVPVSGNSNITIRNSLYGGTGDVLQEIIIGGKTVSNLPTRKLLSLKHVGKKSNVNFSVWTSTLLGHHCRMC
jgi:hypothetical protein